MQVEVEVAGNRKLEHTGVKVELIGLIGKYEFMHTCPLHRRRSLSISIAADDHVTLYLCDRVTAGSEQHV